MDINVLIEDNSFIIMVSFDTDLYTVLIAWANVFSIFH